MGFMSSMDTAKILLSYLLSVTKINIFTQQKVSKDVFTPFVLLFPNCNLYPLHKKTAGGRIVKQQRENYSFYQT